MTSNATDLDFVKRTCDPCKFENTERKAQGFCRMCREYLCEKCEQFHRKFQATRSHKIVHGVLMPKPVKKSMTSCEHHSNNVVEFVCKEHGDVICKTCKRTKHSTCKGVVPLSLLQNENIEKVQLETLADKLQNMVEEFRNVSDLRKQDSDGVSRQRETCYETVRDIRAKLNEIFDHLEKKLLNDVEKIYSDEFKKMSEDVRICDSSIGAIESVIGSVKSVWQTEDTIAKLAMFYKGGKILQNYRKVIGEIKREAQTVELEVAPDEEVDKLVTTIKAIGSVKHDAIPKTFRLKLKEIKGDKMRVVETNVHSVRMADDDKEHDCEVTGSAFLHNGCLVICDKHNQRLKFLDRAFVCTFDIKLESSPWDVAEVNANWVITTLPFAKKLQFVNADMLDGPRKGRTIKVDRMCWGVAVSAEEIFVSCHDNPGQGQIRILDKRGHTKKVIDAEAEGAPFVFELPSYIAVSEAADKIFVSDGDSKRTITCLNKRHGDIVYDYCVSSFGYSRQTNADNYQSPWSFKIMVDEEDYILANVGDKDMIQVISDQGEKYKTLLRNTEELFGPHTMSYRESDATLVIGLWDQIQSFKFKEMEVRT